MNPKRLAFIDYIRGFAILGVFLFHALTGADRLLFSGWTRDFSDLYRDLLLPMNFGWLGVAVFFVVSGFCIHLSFEQQGRRWKEFFIRRFFRLYPPYLVAVLFFALVLPQSRLNFRADDLAGLNFANHFLLIHNLHPKTYWGINPSFWSIGVEVQLYLLYPVLVYVAGRHGWRRSLWLAGACEVAIAASKVLLPLTGPGHGLLNAGAGWAGPFLQAVSQLGITPLATWFSWALGAMLAESYLRDRPSVLARIPPLGGVTLVVICCLVRDLYPFAFLAAACATASIIARLVEREKSGVLQIPGWLGPMRHLGIYSYSLYLLHQPLMYATTQNTCGLVPSLEHQPLLHYLVSVSTAVFIFPLSYLSYQFLEQPGIRLGKHLIQALGRGTPKGRAGKPRGVSVREPLAGLRKPISQ